VQNEFKTLQKQRLWFLQGFVCVSSGVWFETYDFGTITVPYFVNYFSQRDIKWRGNCGYREDAINGAVLPTYIKFDNDIVNPFNLLQRYMRIVLIIKCNALSIFFV
jgi:hypothetical protein